MSIVSVYIQYSHLYIYIFILTSTSGHTTLTLTSTHPEWWFSFKTTMTKIQPHGVASQLTWTNTVHQLAFPRHRNEQQNIVFYVLATFNKYQARCLLSRPEVSTGLNPCFEILHRWFRPLHAAIRPSFWETSRSSIWHSPLHNRRV
jgi:hypothetical protein